MKDPARNPGPELAPNGPGSDGPARGWSLRARLALFLAVTIALVVGATTWIETRTFERAVEQDLIETAGLTAMAVADDLEIREEPFTPEDLRGPLQGFVDAVPELASISVVTMVGGRPALFAATAGPSHAEALEVGRQAILRKGIVWGTPAGPLRVLGVPVARDTGPFGAVAVTVSFDALDRLRDTGRVIAAWSTLAAIAALFVLIELLVRRFIHRPIDAILHAIGVAATGTLSERAPVVRPDEIGAVADGLNRMLGQLEDLHEGLQQRVSQATAELRGRNRELLDAYQQMFRLREELGRSQQLAAVGETTSAVAHQIGTPLNLVSGHIQVLMEEQGDDSPVTRRLRVAKDQLEKVTAAVRGLLDRTRRPLERKRVDLTQVLERLCTLVQPALESANVRLAFDAAGPRPVQADVSQIELALLNLFSNALDAMPGGGRLTVAVSGSGGVARVELTDTGMGMPAELAERAFEPWVTTKPPGRGTGLGLSIARSVVVEHGGRIGVRSSPGAGTTITVDLPMAGAPQEEAPGHA